MRILYYWALICACVNCHANLSQQSVSELEGRLESVELEVHQLARPSLRGGVGSIGYHSSPFENADHPFWVRIDWNSEEVIDQVVLVPVLWRDFEQGFKADAFPAAFKVFAGTADDPVGVLVAEYRQSGGVPIGISPLVLAIPETTASWVRVEVLHMSPRIHDDRYVFQLAEIIVFSGVRNVALRQSIQTSFKKPKDPSGAWDERFLVDGSMPYLMDSVRGQSSLGYMSEFGTAPNLNIDLGAEYAISEIRLHAVVQSNTVPQAYFGDLGIPKHFRVEGGSLPDFSDATVLLNYRSEKISDTGPVMMWNIPESVCRYVRLVTIEPNVSFGVSDRLSRVGFAEIELISNGENIAKEKTVWLDNSLNRYRARSLEALTDGQNLFGEILSIRAWLNELAQRNELEQEQVELSAELSGRYERQKVALAWMRWAAVALLVLIGFIILYARMVSVRKEAKIRERIAANLHDELGANLHAIGMLSDLAQESADSPASLADILQRIRGLTERTGAAARYCSNMLEARGICENLVDDMKREANRLLTDISYEIAFQNEAGLNGLKRRRRIDIYLFFKESLMNILRHGQASTARVALSMEKREVRLTICDNGQGFEGGVPRSLMRRARLMRANVTVEHPDEGGTIIQLKLKVNTWSPNKK